MTLAFLTRLALAAGALGLAWEKWKLWKVAAIAPRLVRTISITAAILAGWWLLRAVLPGWTDTIGDGDVSRGLLIGLIYQLALLTRIRYQFYKEIGH